MQNILFIAFISALVFVFVISSKITEKLLRENDIKNNKLTERVYGYWPLQKIKNEEYIKTDYNTACAMYNSGIEFKYNSIFNIFYFYYEDKYNKKIIYCLMTEKEAKKFSKFLENTKLSENESKEGYEYIINKIHKYRTEQENEVNNAIKKLQESLESPTLKIPYTPPASVHIPKDIENKFVNACFYKGRK